ncbi:GNAT family N-acetyltransferase [Paenibacillus oceani]|uniref:GNAT family N-acetyltransferase n=1 Tax=Paenibacillus oceani TaxID=2772510 RepID=UPI00295A9421|nr:GNAT family N-acetyltransferase [Paenibacillus oceani]
MNVFVSFLFEKSFLLDEDVWGYFDGDRLLGLYIAENPQEGKLPIRQMVQLAWRTIPLLFRLPGKTFGFLNSYMRVTRSIAPSFPHRYLILIGVEPEARGRGIGKALLLHLLAEVQADSRSQGVALDTENTDNVTLYERFGFTLNKEVLVCGLPVYSMAYIKKGS